MGDALLILVEIFAWGLILLSIGALLETGWAKIRRKRKDTLTG
ncbi:MAG TPA: hypothetical protein VH817_20860 [Thermoleophilaceae bacterium]|jgi:hypothetical protein